MFIASNSVTKLKLLKIVIEYYNMKVIIDQNKRKTVMDGFSLFSSKMVQY